MDFICEYLLFIKKAKYKYNITNIKSCRKHSFPTMEKKPPSSPTKITTKPQASLPLKTTPSNNKSPEIKLKNDKKEGTESSDDDEILDEISVESKIKQLSPTKYFQKRVSCDYMKLKSIEKPMRRASAIDAGLGLGMLKDPNSQAYLVKFSTITEEIKTEENENNKKVLRNDKPKRSILKNTFAEEELVLDKIFEKKSLTELIEKIDKSAFGNPKLYNDLIPKVFLEYWLANQSNLKKAWFILQV